MTYTQADRLLMCASLAEGSRDGVTLDELQRAFGFSRRSAERLRDAALASFPDLEEVRREDRRKAWRLPSGTVRRWLQLDADDFVALEQAARALEREGLPPLAETCRRLAGKLALMVRPDRRNALDVDVEASMEAEGLALRPGPRIRIHSRTLESLRHAIRSMQELRLTYFARSTGRTTSQCVWPYGLLFGQRHYLVAYSQASGQYRLFGVPEIVAVQPTGQAFARCPDFSLEAYARQSFGVFQEEPEEIVWRFSRRASDRAAEWQFHPSQSTIRDDEGRLVVTFVAGGFLEMAWHLAIWGDEVEVLSPPDFWPRVLTQRESFFSYKEIP